MILLDPPQKFDANEWFILGVIVFMLIVILKLPKTFTPLFVSYLTVFNFFLSTSVDFIIAAPPFDLYDVADQPKHEIMDIVIYLILYPQSAYVAMWIYNRWEWRGGRLFMFLLAISVINVGLEYIAILFNLYRYKGWNLLYSGPVYFAVWFLNVWLLHFLKRTQEKTGIPFFVQTASRSR
jgi:hypothetical protein